MFGKLSLTLIQGIVKLSYSLLSIYSFLATTSADTTVNIWQTADFSLKKTLKEANQRWVWDCAFSEDSQSGISHKSLSSVYIRLIYDVNTRDIWAKSF